MGTSSAIRWRIQPRPCEIDWGHPLAQGLVLFYDGRRGINRVVAGELLTNNGSIPPPISAGGPVRGLAHPLAFGSSQYWSLARSVSTSLPISYAAYCRSTFGTGNFQTVLNIAETANDRMLRMSFSTTNTLSVQHIGATATGTAATTATLGPNVWGHVGAIFRSNTDRSAYMHGRNKVSNTTDSGNTAPVKTTIGIFNGATTVFAFDGQIGPAAIWAKDIGDEGQRAYWENPWQFCKPYVRRIYVDFGADAPPPPTGSGLRLVSHGGLAA